MTAVISPINILVVEPGDHVVVCFNTEYDHKYLDDTIETIQHMLPGCKIGIIGNVNSVLIERGERSNGDKEGRS